MRNAFYSRRTLQTDNSRLFRPFEVGFATHKKLGFTDWDLCGYTKRIVLKTHRWTTASDHPFIRSKTWARSLYAPILLGSLLMIGLLSSQLGLILSFNIIYLSAIAGLLWLERWIPYRTDWQQSDGQVWRDIGHTLMSKGGGQIMVGIAYAAMGSQSHGIWPNQWPIWAQLLLSVPLIELGLYIAHFLGHKLQTLWWFHSIHHMSERLWVINTGRFHFGDAVVSVAMSVPIWLILGASPDIMLWYGFFAAIVGLLSHCNVDFHTPWLNFILMTPSTHRWHHWNKEVAINLSENVVLYDHVFGTFQNPTGDVPSIGITDRISRDFSQQLAYPFKMLLKSRLG